MRRNPALVLIVSLCALLWTGCSKPPPQPLRIGLLVWVGYSPFYVAAERKLYAPVEAELTTLSAHDDLNRALIDKKLDVGSSTLFDALRLADQGVDVRIIMAIDASNGADGIVAAKGITSVAALKGKRVAADVGSVSHFLLLRALERAGLSPSDVELVNVTAEQAALDLKRGAVDAAVTWEPFLSKGVADGGNKIFTSAEIPGEIVDVLLVAPETVERRRADLVAMVRGWDKAIGLWRSQPADVLPLMARTQSMKVDELTESLKGLELIDLASNRQLFERSERPKSLWKAYEATARFVVDAKLVKQPPRPAASMLDARIVDDAFAK